jgi:hypothetical protein
MILHCVFLSFRGDVAAGEIAACMDHLSRLQREVDGMLSFAAGPNRDYEGKSPDHPYGFVITFRDRKALMAYDAHPQHKAAGRWLVAHCEGGAEGIVVYDLETG